MTWGLGGAAVALSGWWAMATPEIQREDMPSVRTPSAGPSLPEREANRPEFDLDSLVVQLWNPPPAPVEVLPAESVTQAEPTPMRLQLIGIIEEGEIYKAALYDPDDDRIHIVSDGSTIGSITVQTITASLVSLTDGDHTQSLELITGREGPPS